MKRKLSKIAGLTLIEILIAIVISSLMMLAMFTSYTIVNSTYRQVTDRAKISQAGRDLVGQVLREIRMAGFKYLNDDYCILHRKIFCIINKKSKNFCI